METRLYKRELDRPRRQHNFDVEVTSVSGKTEAVPADAETPICNMSVDIHTLTERVGNNRVSYLSRYR